MMLYQAGRGIDPGKIYVRLNPGNDGAFAVIELAGSGGAALFIKSAAEADALIKAAVEAKRLLAPPEPGCDCMDDPASPDAAEALIDAIVAGTPVRTAGHELCDSVMFLPNGGELKCTADAGHYGAHTAISGKYRWLGHGADARTEEGELIATVTK